MLRSLRAVVVLAFLSPTSLLYAQDASTGALRGTVLDILMAAPLRAQPSRSRTPQQASTTPPPPTLADDAIHDLLSKIFND
jgi:hypothetical protein